MNLAELHRRLIATAKADAPDERVPFTFEKRVMARIRSRSPLDALSLWSQGLWRAAVSCVALTLLLGAVSWFSPGYPAPGDLDQDFESTLLAVADQDASADVSR